VAFILFALLLNIITKEVTNISHNLLAIILREGSDIPHYYGLHKNSLKKQDQELLRMIRLQ